ncbi:hypothetical protein SAMN05446037_105024 [Anaerovirgula multivorans]|uniref:Uncharacterized protein n=1 Tax=Anaerovirgula multivorans TaxID=312168 RepID=A0A239KPC6_9FIRM|nr:hypothetical protein SAMN05446037_105024 [Anaerovirgula multivorans]
MSKVKSIDSLMKYLRDKHNINISGKYPQTQTTKYRVLSWI